MSNSGVNGNGKLRADPNMNHKPQNYDDPRLGIKNPRLFQSLESYLPPMMINRPIKTKANFMKKILSKYTAQDEYPRVQKHEEYKKIQSNYRPLHPDLYTFTLTPEDVFKTSFLWAIKENTEEGFRNIMTEPSPGIFVFDMLQPHFCELLLLEVKHFENWVCEMDAKIMLPSTLHKFGVVLDDFGLDGMLGKLMENFIRPISKVFFPEVGGATLDSHHGFIVEYGVNRNVDLDMHVDDAEVTLNVCLEKCLSGGELCFQGVRCKNHLFTRPQPEEAFNYSHVLGQAVLHRGSHRHCARATISGERSNLLLWCRSSAFRNIKKKSQMVWAVSA